MTWRFEWQVGRHAGLVKAPFIGELEVWPAAEVPSPAESFEPANLAEAGSQSPDPDPVEPFRRWTVKDEEPIDLRLPRTAGWRLQLVADGWWMRDQLLAIGSAPSAEVVEDVELVKLVVLPTSRLKIRALERSDRGGIPLPALRVRLEAGRPGKSSWAASGAWVECDAGAKAGDFFCTVPVDPRGRTDLALRPEGYVPLYWTLELPAHGLKPIGSLYLVPGASVAGWIRGSKNEPIPRGSLELTLERLVADGEGHLHTEVVEDLGDLGTRFGAGGFFQIPQVLPGSYRLRIQVPGFEALLTEAIEVVAGEEVRFEDVLVLESSGEGT